MSLSCLSSHQNGGRHQRVESRDAERRPSLCCWGSQHDVDPKNLQRQKMPHYKDQKYSSTLLLIVDLLPGATKLDDTNLLISRQYTVNWKSTWMFQLVTVQVVCSNSVGTSPPLGFGQWLLHIFIAGYSFRGQLIMRSSTKTHSEATHEDQDQPKID